MTPLAERALRGLAHAPAGSPPLPGLPPDLAALVAGLPPAEALLAAAGALALTHDAGFAPRRGVLPPPPCGDTPERRASPAEAAALAALWADPALLTWACDRLAAAGRALPPALLPRALATPAQATALRSALRPALGPRGRWLAAQHAPWRWAAADLHDADALAATHLDAPDPLERLAALAALRRLDPARARAALDATWRGEPPRLRALGLRQLEPRLGPDDEPFLEAALRDRAAEVRSVARLLLVALPGSALVARRAALAPTLLRWRPAPAAPLPRPLALALERVAGPGHATAPKLALAPPASPPADPKADGLAAAFPGAGADPALGWTCQVLADAPPAAWFAPLDPALDPAAALAALPPDDPLVALVLARAVAAHRVHALARPLARWLAVTAPPGDRDHDAAIALLTGVMPPLDEADLCALLGRSAALAQTRYAQTLGLAPTPWSRPVAQAFAEALLDALGPGGPLGRGGGHPFLEAALDDAPTALPDGLLVPLLGALRPRLSAPPGAPAPPASVRRFAERVALRARLLAAGPEPEA